MPVLGCHYCGVTGFGIPLTLHARLELHLFCLACASPVQQLVHHIPRLPLQVFQYEASDVKGKKVEQERLQQEAAEFGSSGDFFHASLDLHDVR
jgi:hypothetical protein